MGIFFALSALLAWGFGDFLIQRSTRKIGNIVALFYITAFASVVLLPFVYKDIFGYIQTSDFQILGLLLFATLLTLTASVLDFEALRVGKISVVEPIYAFEVFVTIVLGSVFLHEYPTPIQFFLILLLSIGVIFVGTKSITHLSSISWEKGVLLAVLATLTMGGVNFMFGVMARATNPLVINWFTSLFITVFCLLFLAKAKRLGEILTSVKNNFLLILSVSVLDNIAWISFAYSTLYIQIAITTSISESYIAIAALLGLVINKEKLQRHQYIGLVLVLIAGISLSMTINK